MDIMVTLIEAYETRHFPVDLPDSVEAIKIEMNRKDLREKNHNPMINKSNRVYGIHNYKHSLKLKMIWKFHKVLCIPSESLIEQHQAHA